MTSLACKLGFHKLKYRCLYLRPGRIKHIDGWVLNNHQVKCTRCGKREYSWRVGK